MPTFYIDQKAVSFEPGQTIIQAALAAEIYIPHLCFHPEFVPHGSCRVCVVEVNGRLLSSCTTPATEGCHVNNMGAEVQAHRRQLLEMLFVEGNHVCPSCEKSGDCTLQSVAEYCGMLTSEFTYQFPNRPLDASHADFILDYNRCILCELCVRASRDVDHKSIFSIRGRGHDAHLVVNAQDGQLGSTDFAIHDRAAHVCPVGVILPRDKGFKVPIGRRTFDQHAINETSDTDDR